MSDGAHGGITPERALKTIIGGKPAPKADEGMSVQEMRAWIEAAPDDPGNYNDGCRLIAKLVMQHYAAHPDDGMLPPDSRRDYTDGYENAPILELGLYDAIQQRSPAIFAAIDQLDMTGFMWGWSVNAARRCFEMPPMANPAILTIGGAS